MPYGSGPKGNRRRMAKFTINELSGVDVPAQSGAQALILKRHTPDDPAAATRKGTVVQAATDTTDGHQHGIEISVYDNRTHLWLTSAVSKGADTSHDHQLIMGATGAYTVSENAGHTHTIDDAALNAVIATAVAKSEPQPEGHDVDQKELDALKAKNERLEKIIQMNAVTKAFYDGLAGDEAKDSFVEKSAEDQAAQMQKAEDDAAAEKAKREAEDPLVYTTKSGIEIRKSDGTAALALAKQADEDRASLETMKAENAELKKATEAADYMKQARTEFAHLPGTAEETAAHLKAIDSIEDEGMRKRAREQLRQQNSALAPFFGSIGTDSGNDVGKAANASGDNADQKLDELTKKYIEANKGTSYEKAYAAVLQSPEGAEIYTQQVQMAQHAPAHPTA